MPRQIYVLSSVKRVLESNKRATIKADNETKVDSSFNPTPGLTALNQKRGSFCGYNSLDPRTLLFRFREEQSKASLIGAFMLARGVSRRRKA